VRKSFVVHVGARLHLGELRYNCKEHRRDCELGKAELSVLEVFFSDKSFFGPVHKALATYLFIKFIFVRLVMRTMEHVLSHVFAFGA